MSDTLMGIFLTHTVDANSRTGLPRTRLWGVMA